MCGITGWVDLNRNLTKDKDILVKMTNTLANRGPDGEDYYITPQVALGHRRLSVIDPAGGGQPMTKNLAGNSYTIVYNGELYNTQELRDELMARGHKFRSHSDTEVLLTSYIEWGPDAVTKLNGIFAFGIWEANNQTLFLARDPLGVKPLFYSQVQGSLLFASEIKALLANPWLSP